MSKKPTILYVSLGTELYGAELCLLQLLQGLSQKGYTLIVAVLRPGPLTERLDALKIPVIYIPFMKRWLTMAHSVSRLKGILYNLYQIPYLLYTAFILRKIIYQHQVDLVHTSTSISFDGALAAFLTNVPHVWHIHETIEPGKTWRFFLGARAARKLITRFSDKIITTSEAIRNLYLNTSHNAQKIQVVYNGVDLNLGNNSISGPTLRQKLGIPNEARLVGLVGRVTPLKRYEDFLQAAVIVKQTVSDSYFLAVGDGDNSSYGQKVKKLSQELGLADRVIWMGFCEKIDEIFKGIDVLVLPSDEESTPRVIVEAMAAQKPVVATAVGGVPEQIVDKVTGFLVPPRSPADLAQSIIKILQTPQLADTMGKAGRQRAENWFSLEQYVDNIEAIYLDLLNDHE